MGDTSPTPYQLLVEAAIFWSIGVCLFIGRLISRVISNGGIKHLFSDDYIMIFTFCFYTTLLVLIRISAEYATNLMDPNDYDQVLSNPQDVADRIYGSKIVIGLEQCMLFSTWGVKSCMIILYWRLTKGLRMNLYVKLLAGYIALGLVVIEVSYFGIYCRPFSQYWAMPVQDMQCATYQHYSITQAVFNISSDSGMLAIPIPLLIKTQIELKKKILLMAVMSMGIFVVIAAILNKYFNFASPLTTTYQIWYIREASTAIYVANLMCWWPLLRKIFGWKAFVYSIGPYQNKRQSGHSRGFSSLRASTTQTSKSRSAFPATEKPSRRSTNNEYPLTAREETIDVEPGDTEDTGYEMPHAPLEIWHKVEYGVAETNQITSTDTITSDQYSDHTYHAEVTCEKTTSSAPMPVSKYGKRMTQ